MLKRLRLTKDLLSGLMFVVVGVGATIIGQSYSRGTLTNMGPGFFPATVALIVAGLGIVIVVKEFFTMLSGGGQEALEFGNVVPFLGIPGAVLAFGLLINSAGLIVAIAAVVVIGRLVSRDFQWREVGLIIAVLSGLCLVIFYFLLKIPLKVLPW